MGMASRVTNETLKEHKVFPFMDSKLLSSFFSMLIKEMGTLSLDTTIYEVILANLLLRRVIKNYSYHELWITYIKDKVKGGV